MKAFFFPGLQPDANIPLGRFLPPYRPGSGAQLLACTGNEGDLILDPFGVSPHLVVEAAKEGRAVLVAAGNPIQSFLIESLARPHSTEDLRAALGYLAGLPKDGTRMEPFLLDLYRTQCLHCGADAYADYFIWDRDSGQVTLKAYTCEGCHFAGEVMATEEDQNLAAEFEDANLSRSMAMNRIVSADDPDRRNVSDALDAYPARTLYALVTILNKLDQLPPREDILPAVRALLLSAFDAGTKLWGHPEGRARPRQLTASPQYREVNIWRALEKGLLEWNWRSTPNPVALWKEGQSPRPGEIMLFPGSLRQLPHCIDSEAVSMVLTIPPRPNQAYWTLSALWAAWLWGREEPGQLRAALRRRRYDWNWHAIALHSAWKDVGVWLQPSCPVTAFVPEVEPGYLAAVLMGMTQSGFCLEGAALRMESQGAVFHWRRSKNRKEPSTPSSQIEDDVKAILLERGEPADYPLLHGYAWCAMASRDDLLDSWRQNPEQPLQPALEGLHAVLDAEDTFLALRSGVERERRRYWLKDPPDGLLPLSDRIETHVVDALRKRRFLTQFELDSEICRRLPGRLTPPGTMLLSCLRSYAVEDEGVWRLRPQDEEDARIGDMEEIEAMLCALGGQFAYDVQHERGVVVWREGGEPCVHYRIQSTAHLAPLLDENLAPNWCLVIPGGRARLFAEKLRLDPRVEAGGVVIKFRHVRRLADEGLTSREAFLERLEIDPPAYQDPQLPLL